MNQHESGPKFTKNKEQVRPCAAQVPPPPDARPVFFWRFFIRIEMERSWESSGIFNHTCSEFSLVHVLNISLVHHAEWTYTCIPVHIHKEKEIYGNRLDIYSHPIRLIMEV